MTCVLASFLSLPPFPSSPSLSAPHPLQISQSSSIMVPILSYVYSVLPKLETHLPTILASASFFFALEFTSGKISEKYSSSYRNHSKKTQIAWNSNVAGQCFPPFLVPYLPQRAAF